MPDASCPGWVQKKVYVPAAIGFTSNSRVSPAETSSLVAIVLPDESRIAMSCCVEPEFTSQNTTFPLAWVIVEGSNLNSVIVTWIDPAGWALPPPPPLPPQAASNATATSPAARLLI